MVIKASASAEIRLLVDALAGDDEVRREAAIARLSIIGSRAVDRLTAAYKGSTARDTRVAILRALESIGDDRTVKLACAALADGGDLSVAATAVLRGLLDSTHQATASEALDALVTVALDSRAPHRLRLAAFEALQEMPVDVRERVAAALRDDPDPALKAAAIDAPRDTAAAEALWQDALEGRLPDRPGDLREALQTRAATAPLTTLQVLIDRIHQREGSLPAASERAAWATVRGALHQALALRGSRLVVYDLRESIAEAREPLPTSFLAALHVIGDESCLEPLAAAHARTADPRWKMQVREAFDAIMRRERLTARHGVVKKILARWPAMTE